MIVFRPVPSSESLNEIAYEAVEDNSVCGICHMTYNPQKATVDSITYDEDKPYIVEGLLKSIFNFAAQNNIYIGCCTCANIAAFLDRMNFEKTGDTYYNDIPSILTGNCCKKV